MFASRPLAPRRFGALTWLAFPLLALLPAALQVSGCTDDSGTAAKTDKPDASVSACSPGTRACSCTSDGDCDPGLLCNSGRCFDTEGTQTEPPDPDVRPPLPVVMPIPRVDASVPASDASTDSGSSSNG